MAEPLVIVVMGVSGSGKTTLGKALARALHAPFIDADDLHPVANRAKMAAGTPLGDDDRWPWLDEVGGALAEASRRKGIAVGACSALRRAYRERLETATGAKLLFVHVAGDPQLIAERLAKRQGHFMPPALLPSQFATLEAPASDENAITVEAGQPTERQVAAVLRAIPGLRVFRRKQ